MNSIADKKAHRPALRPWSRLLPLAFCALSMFAVFYVPTLIPGEFVESDSYRFGYNNRVGFLLFVALTSIGSFWWRRFRIDCQPSGASERLGRRSLWIGLAAGLAICIFMYVLTSRIGEFGESTYLINRIELASRGLRPYKDFEYIYGESFLYIPILLSRVLHLSLPNGYYLFWTLNVLTGIWMLWEVINRLDSPSKYKNNVFVLVYLSLLPGILTTGTNYTGFRFLVGPFLALIVFQTIRGGRLNSQILGSAQVLVFAFLLLFVSPEVGVAFCIGVSAFFFLFYLGSASKVWLLPYLCMMLLIALLITADGKLGAFSTIKSFATGGYNFPVIPAPHILLLFATVFLCACYIAECLSTGRFRSNSFLLLLVSIPLLSASMGRCDPAHVLFDILGAFIFCMLRISNNHLLWKWYRLAFVITFIVLFSFTSLLFYANNVSRAVASHFRSKELPDASKDFSSLPPQLKGTAQIPFAYFASHNPTGLEGGYYFGLVSAVDTHAVALKISELANNPDRDLVLPADFDGHCQSRPDESRWLIRVLFAYPFNGKAVHPQNIYAPLCDYIDANYSLKVPPQPASFNYGIWTRKQSATPASIR